MADWRERDHPRDPHTGEFVDKAGGWVGIVAGRWFEPPKPYPGTSRVKGRRDLDGDLDYESLHQALQDSYGVGDDPALDAIWDLQGYHGRPTLYDQDEMDDLIREEGYVELFRGVSGDTGAETVEYAQQFREGDRQYAGRGTFGNGTYSTTSSNEVHEYTRADSRYPERDDPDEHLRYPGIIRMALPPDARVIDHGALRDEYYRLVEGIDEDREDGPRETILYDEGRLASILGYDAIRRNMGGVSHYIILNRTAVAVQYWDPPGETPPAPERQISRRDLLEELDLGYEFEVLVPDTTNWAHVDRWSREGDDMLLHMAAGSRYSSPLRINDDYHFTVRPWNG